MLTCQLYDTVKKMLNYKKGVISIFVEEQISFFLDTDTCECKHFQVSRSTSKTFYITRDLRIIQNSRVWELITKSPSIESPALLILLMHLRISTINSYIQDLFLKNKLSSEYF